MRKRWHELIPGESLVERKKRLRRLRVNRWAAKNRLKNRQRCKDYRLRFPEKVRAGWKAARLKNPVLRSIQNKRWREGNREKRSAYCAKWRAENKHRLKGYDARRRANRRLREGQSLVEDKYVSAVISKWKTQPDFVCYYCKKRFGRERLHVDHIIPLCSGGKHSTDNICKSCDTCNQRKRATMPDKITFLNQPVLAF